MDDDYEPLNDYEEQMDAVRLGLVEYDDVHCVHGTFVGNWAGPDYMCGPCEMGITDEEWAEEVEARRIHNERVRAAKDTFFALQGDEAGQLEFLTSDEGKWLFR